MSEPRCYHCGYLLDNIDAACPICLPDFYSKVPKVPIMNDLPIRDAETYLGDGLYVSFDGFNIKLRAPRPDGDHWVALEPDSYRELQTWINSYPRLRRHMNGG